MELYADGQISPTLSLLLVGLTTFVHLAVLFVGLRDIFIHLRLGRSADRLISASAPLVEGEVYVSGTAELHPEHEFAIRVEIEQKGSEHKGRKSGWSHTWSEVQRRVFKFPFCIRHASGELIHVEPQGDIYLVDDLDQVVQHQPARRFRIAELSEGEEIIAEGELLRTRDPTATRGYRELADTRWVLRPRHGKERFHLSAEKLGKHHRRRARRVSLALLWWLGCFLIGTGLVSSYLARLIYGEDKRATILSKRHYTTRTSKGATVHHYEVDYHFNSYVSDAVTGQMSSTLMTSNKSEEALKSMFDEFLIEKRTLDWKRGVGSLGSLVC